MMKTGELPNSQIISLNQHHPVDLFKPLKTIDDLVLGEITLGETSTEYVYRKRFDGLQISVSEIGKLAKKAKKVPSLLYYPKILAYSTQVATSY